ncbi:asparagine synthase [Denitromonas ohlonensis]|uniref:asparagine synthase (glutamine-hydrolyzing) n=3 Tax=Denitromonas TaxID=139331 RepID=A0A558CKE3_9RHOO|nr:asparagine synthase [Denitromonas ohlonensis]TVO75080.1 asparagine synthase [Denitromonas ohlonensis]TVT49214.1 MAG: asparagine synthase [Denitromonas halophila]TVT73490.1 MAG: asparagine synthase [Denitromonas halophila]
MTQHTSLDLSSLSTASNASPLPQRAPKERLQWPHAEAALSDKLILDERDGVLCLSRGKPVFKPADFGGEDIPASAAAAWRILYAKYGQNAPNHVQGRFAIAIVDRNAQSVFLATDRFGTHPWCFTRRGSRLLFADRADALSDNSSEIDPQAIFSYLFHHVIPAPQTIFKDIQRLEGGHRLLWLEGKLQIDAWWRPTFHEPARMDFAETKQQFLHIVETAVARAAEHGKVGAFLSGGTDSSTVAGMLGKVTGKPAETYSMGFDASGYDEMDFARTASQHFGTHHHEYYVTPGDLLEGIPKVAQHYDQPFGNSSAVPAWLCARFAKQDGIETLLAGDGGDELFGGNTRYAKQKIFGWYDDVPGALRRSLLEPVLNLDISKRIPIVKKAASYVEQARVPLPDRIHQYTLLVRVGADNLLTPDYLSQIDQGAPDQASRDVWARIKAGSDLNRMLAFDWKYTLADNDLPKILGTTDLAGVGVEFPLLDDALLDFSLALPLDYKLRGFKLRWFFKEALRDFLPEAIIKKQKHGFGLPFGVWACQHAGLRNLAGDTLGQLKKRGIIQPALIDRLIDELLPAHPGYYGELVWILMMMELWLSRPATTPDA